MSIIISAKIALTFLVFYLAGLFIKIDSPKLKGTFENLFYVFFGLCIFFGRLGIIIFGTYSLLYYIWMMGS